MRRARPANFRTIIENDPAGIAALQRDLIQRLHDALRRQARVDLARQSFTRQDIENVQHPKPPPGAQHVRHKVHAPAFVHMGR